VRHRLDRFAVLLERADSGFIRQIVSAGTWGDFEAQVGCVCCDYALFPAYGVVNAVAPSAK